MLLDAPTHLNKERGGQWNKAARFNPYGSARLGCWKKRAPCCNDVDSNIMLYSES